MSKENSFYYRKKTTCMPENCQELTGDDCLKCEADSVEHGFKYGLKEEPTNQYISEERIEELKKRPFYKMLPEALERIKKGICVGCEKEITDFRDNISLREHRISGLCQDCQDSVFLGDEE